VPVVVYTVSVAPSMTSSLSPENFRLARDRVVVDEFGIVERMSLSWEYLPGFSAFSDVWEIDKLKRARTKLRSDVSENENTQQPRLMWLGRFQHTESVDG